MMKEIYIIKLRNRRNMRVCYFKSACRNGRGFNATYFDSDAKYLNFKELEMALNYLSKEKEYYDISVITL